MSESKNNTLLNQYLRETRMYCYYELKIATGGRFPFSKIEDNQDEGLPALAKEGLVWKLSDEDSRKKPCDGFCTPPLPAYLVIKFGFKFYFIDYAKIAGMRAQGHKSIDEEEANFLCTKVIHIGT
jgi:hypothetical protein